MRNILKAIRNAYVNTFVGNMRVRDKDGRWHNFHYPEWFDVDCEIRARSIEGSAMPEIFIIRPMRFPHKLNVKKRRFYQCDPREVPIPVKTEAMK